MTQQVDVDLISDGGPVSEPCGTLRTVHFLHTDFDVTTVEGQSKLVDLLAWKKRLVVIHSIHRFIFA